MSITKNNKFCIQVFDKIIWEDILAERTRFAIIAFWTVFSRRAKCAEEEGNKALARMYWFFASLCTNVMCPFENSLDKKDFQNYIANHNTGFNQLTKRKINFLKQIVYELPCPLLKARIGDILWVLKTDSEDYNFAELAIDSYLESAKILEEDELNFKVIEPVERALVLSKQIGNPSKLNLVQKYIKSYLMQENILDKKWIPARFSEIIIDNKLIYDLDMLIKLNSRLANYNLDKQMWSDGREYLKVLNKLYSKCENKEKVKEIKVRLAESYVAEADTYITEDNPNNFLRERPLKNAMIIYQEIGGYKDRIRQLNSQLEKAQRELPKQMKMTKVNLELSEDDIASIERDRLSRIKSTIRGVSLQQDLFNLAFIYTLPRYSELRNTIEKQNQTFAFPHVCTTSKIDKEGKTKAITQPASISNPSINENNTEARMHEVANKQRDYHYRLLIEPARRELITTHYIKLTDVERLMSGSMFFSPDRLSIVAKGIFSGIMGDFLVSSHLLFPQIEAALRYRLHEEKILTSKLKKDGTQEEMLFGEILNQPEFSAVFGEDITFELKGYFIDKHGTNIRNELAHGFIDSKEFSPFKFMNVLRSGLDAEFYRLNSVIGHIPYIWWLTLHLCLRPLPGYFKFE